MLFKLLLISLSLFSSTLFTMHKQDKHKGLWDELCKIYEKCQKTAEEERKAHMLRVIKSAKKEHHAPTNSAPKPQATAQKSQPHTIPGPGTNPQPTEMQSRTQRQEMIRAIPGASQQEQNHSKSPDPKSASRTATREVQSHDKTGVATPQSHVKQSEIIQKITAHTRETQSHTKTGSATPQNHVRQSEIIQKITGQPIAQSLDFSSGNLSYTSKGLKVAITLADKTSTGRHYTMLVKAPDGTESLKTVTIVKVQGKPAFIDVRQQPVMHDGKAILPHGDGERKTAPVLAAMGSTERGRAQLEKFAEDRQEPKKQQDQDTQKKAEPKHEPLAKDLKIPQVENGREPTAFYQKQAEKAREEQQPLKDLTRGHIEAGQVSVDIHPAAFLQPARWVAQRLRLDLPEGISRWGNAAGSYKEFIETCNHANETIKGLAPVPNLLATDGCSFDQIPKEQIESLAKDKQKLQAYSLLVRGEEEPTPAREKFLKDIAHRIQKIDQAIDAAKHPKTRADFEAEWQKEIERLAPMQAPPIKPDNHEAHETTPSNQKQPQEEHRDHKTPAAAVTHREQPVTQPTRPDKHEEPKPSDTKKVSPDHKPGIKPAHNIPINPAPRATTQPQLSESLVKPHTSLREQHHSADSAHQSQLADFVENLFTQKEQQHTEPPAPVAPSLSNTKPYNHDSKKLEGPTATHTEVHSEQPDKEQAVLEKLTRLNLAQLNVLSKLDGGTELNLPNTALLHAIGEHLQETEYEAQTRLALERQKRHAQNTVQKLSKIAQRELSPCDKKRLAAAQAMLALEVPVTQTRAINTQDAQRLLIMHAVELKNFTQFHGTPYQCQLFNEISMMINGLAARFSIDSSSTPEMRKMANTALEITLLADSFNRLGALEHAEALIESAHVWSENISASAYNTRLASIAAPISLCNTLEPLLAETRKSTAFDNAGLVVDFVQTISTTTNAALVAASKQDYPVARMWQDTSTSLMEIYTQTLQEARQNPKPDTHSQGMPLDLSIEHVIKAQLDNIEAIIMTGDADTCLPVIINQAEILKTHAPAAARGIGKGVLKAASPANLAKGLYYTVNGTSRALSFILIQSARFECYTELALKNPAMAQKFLNDFNAENQRVQETLDGIITHMQDEWNKMSGPERTEFIFEAITEFVTAPQFQFAYLKGLNKTFNTVATHMKEALTKIPYAVTAEGIPVPVSAATEMLQEAETLGQKGTEAAKTGERAQKAPAPEPAPSATGAAVAGEKITANVSWDMPTSGKKINGRFYTKHALERMAPDIPQVRAELEARAIKNGYSRSSDQFKKYIQPRNIPPSVVEHVIQHGVREINEAKGTLTYILDGVKVVTNIAGDVVTVHVT